MMVWKKWIPEAPNYLESLLKNLSYSGHRVISSADFPKVFPIIVCLIGRSKRRRNSVLRGIFNNLTASVPYRVSYQAKITQYIL